MPRLNYYHMYIYILAKFQKNRHKYLGGVAYSMYPLSILFDIAITPEKSKPNNQMIISKAHTHLQAMTQTSLKFQKHWHKIVGRVAHTSNTLSIYFYGNKKPKITTFNL